MKKVTAFDIHVYEGIIAPLEALLEKAEVELAEHQAREKELVQALDNLERTAGIPTMYADSVRANVHQILYHTKEIDNVR